VSQPKSDLWVWPLAVPGLGQQTFTTDYRHPWYSLAGSA